jgi:hypothetical protein
MKSMDTPRTRSEFERNFYLLHRRMVDGTIHFPTDYPMQSMLRVRFLPNGRIDFLSVDESARLNANSTAQFSDDGFMNQFEQFEETVDGGDGAESLEEEPGPD